MDAKRKKIILETNFVFFIVTIFLLSPIISSAGEKGYVVTKENETILDNSKGDFLNWQNKVWFTKKRVKVENSQDKNSMLLIYMDKDKIYQIDTQAKTYRVLDFPEGLTDLYGGGSIKSEVMNQRKKCGKWDCYGVMISTKNENISLITEYWLTKDVDIPIDLRKKIAEYFGTDQIALTNELAKYEGYPVQTVLTMKVNDKEIKMISNVIEVKKIEIDPKIFEIPADFKDEDANMEQKKVKEKVKAPDMKQDKPAK